MDARAEMRVRYARDALWQLDHVGHMASHMTYCMPRGRGARTMGEVVAGRCTVCAIGSLMLSAYAGSNFSREAIQSDVIFQKLAEHFDLDQLNLIEAAFEGWAVWVEKVTDITRTDRRAVAFNMHYNNADERLRAILHNLIRNAGTFDVEDFRVGSPPPLPAMQTTTVVQPDSAAPQPATQRQAT